MSSVFEYPTRSSLADHSTAQLWKQSRLSLYHNSSTNSNKYDEYSEDDEEECDPYEEMKENHVNNAFCDSSSTGVENFCFKGSNATTDYAANGLQHNSGFGREETFGMEMYLARGLGISEFSFDDIGGGHINGGNGGGRGRGSSPVTFDGDGPDGHGFVMEQHYENMLADPNSSLCLRNYAQFLHQTKKGLPCADEYYGRAILADPTDGEVLCQYAKLVWDLYHDSHRARDYFERAIRAAGEDSHVQAAYACFLWETCDEEEEDCSLSEGPMKLPVS